MGLREEGRVENEGDQGGSRVDTLRSSPPHTINAKTMVKFVGWGTMTWEHAPKEARTMWEAALAEAPHTKGERHEFPTICSLQGLLVTNRALLVAEKWPARPRPIWGKVIRIGQRADRYELKDMSDLDEDGFTYNGTRKSLKWNRASAGSEFLDALVKQEPKLAPKFAAEKAQEQVRRAAREFDQDVGRNLGIEQRRLLRAIKSEWGGVEFFAGDTFSMIRDGYLEWFRAEA